MAINLAFMIKVFINQEAVYYKPLVYTLKLLNPYLDSEIIFSKNKEHANFIFDHTDKESKDVNVDFFHSIIIEKKYGFEYYFKNEPIILHRCKIKKDYLGTVFYLVNCLQEYETDSFNHNYDNFGRFKFERSLQFRYNCIEENLVEKYLIEFCKEELKINEFREKKLAKVFLSHDIDSVNGSLLQDGKWAFKKGRFDIVLKLIFNEVINKPHWKNIDYINKIHSEKGLESAFFWLATNEEGRFSVKNADYQIKDVKELTQYSQINGIHKSSCEKSIKTELELLPFPTFINRHHFLMFKIPELWGEVENSNLKLDASLGFAERYGFRNSFGLPFRPYNFSTGEAYSFIEVPLNIMDGTFQKYMKVPIENTADTIINFFEKNKYNTVLSILWHNTFFTNYKYKGYLDQYKKVLTYLVESKVNSITPDEIIRIYES